MFPIQGTKFTSLKEEEVICQVMTEAGFTTSAEDVQYVSLNKVIPNISHLVHEKWFGALLCDMIMQPSISFIQLRRGSLFILEIH